jgi:hypothetical protein
MTQSNHPEAQALLGALKRNTTRSR